MKKNGTDIGTIGGLFLVCIFAACMFMTLAFGSLIYKDVSNGLEEQYSVRTVASYLSTRARQGNAEGYIEIGSFDGCDAMMIYEGDEFDRYVTYIYCWNGYLRELYCQESQVMTVQDGETVIPADYVSFSMQNGLLKIECSAENRTAVQYMEIYGGEVL